MIYKRYYSEHPFLRQFVRFYWQIKHTKSNVFEFEPKLTPVGEVNILLNFGDAFSWSGKNGERKEVRGSHVTGQLKEYRAIRQNGQIDLLGISFSATGLYPFFRFPLSEIANSKIGLDLIWGSFARELEERVYATSSVRDRISLLERSLLEIARGEFFREPTVDFALTRLNQQKGRLKISQLCTEANTTPRKLERQFNKLVGISPKLYSRIKRFNYAFDLLRTNGKSNLAAIAYDCGYYDQSHFIQDFKLFSGDSPVTYLEKKDTFVDFYEKS